VDEWDKQLGTFSVGPKGRYLDIKNPETAIIVINADFTEERPLFALQEYISYADAELQLSHRWAVQTQATVDGRGYIFPWHQIEGDVRLQGVPPHPLKFELDRGRLLDLLVGHTIYNDPTVAIRELLQNSIDAVRFQNYLDKKEASIAGDPAPMIGEVLVRWDPTNRLLSVLDSGIGMDRDIIQHHLMSVGSSYYSTPQFETENKTFTPISRFGIGILTCFMVSDDIEIVTVKCTKGHRIRMTSVKSTYLLRELEIGDKLLEGLGSHGTQVTLRLRDTVDLSDRSIEDILRYWIILPECNVKYEEFGKELKAIGFTSAKEALLALDKTDISSLSEDRLVVVKNSNTFTSTTGYLEGSYEVALAVRKGFYPEREFCKQYNPGTRVCIEGIRVSDILPGFENSGDSPLALLSVKGSRLFRTTVSRSGLEEDEGYWRVSENVIEMLYSHLSDEVKRISEKPGNPLSQASSAKSFLFSQLLRAIRSKRVIDYIEKIDEQQPSIVFEEVEQGLTKRSLISAKDLVERDDFWTLEARSVDSLNLISRDLGRELSLNQFLSALAPDLVQSQYSPLISDAHQHERIIKRSYFPVNVEFSRQSQQTATYWHRKQDDYEDLRFLLNDYLKDGLYRNQLIDTLRDIGRRTDSRSYSEYSTRISNVDFDIYITSINGDDSNVNAVRSRISLMLKADCPILGAWRSIRACMIHCATTETSVSALTTLIQLANMFTTISHKFATGDQALQLFNTTSIQRDWSELVERAQNSLAINYVQQIPNGVGEFVKDLRVFDATKYWLNWDRRQD